MNSTPNPAAGIVLCGGRSSRMGRPKAWLPFGNEVLLQRTVRILTEVVDPVVVVAAPGQELPALPGHVVIVHDEREYLGPLNGLVTGLAALEGVAEVAYLSSCDVPFLQAAFVRRIIEQLGDADLCLPEVAGYRHPLAAAYRVTLLHVARSLIESGQLRPVALADLRPCRILREDELIDVDPELQSLRNVNTPEDYEAALRSLAQAPAGPPRP